MALLRIVTLLAFLGTTLACDFPNECTSQCYAKLAKAGCQSKLQTMGEALQDQNISFYCSTANSYTTCLDTTFATCDSRLDKATFSGGMDETIDQLCKGSPVDMCRMTIVSCSSKMQGDPADMGPEMCGKMQAYLGCVKELMKGCDPSVTQEQLIGPMQASFNMQCGGTGGGTGGGEGGMCTGIATCLGSLMGSGSQGQGDDSQEPAVDIVNQCGVIATALNCLYTARQKCKAKSPQSYTFADVGGLYTEGCKVLSSNKDMLTCPQFDRCMNTFQFPSDPAKLATLTSDPQFWCSTLKNVMECGAKSPECDHSGSDFASFQKDVNEVCPEAQVTVTAEGSGSIIYPGLLTIVSSFLALLSTRL